MLRNGLMTITLLAMVGCASLPDDVEDDPTAVTRVATEWTQALAAHDVDALMALHSEDFMDEDGNSKADFREFIASTIEEGMLDNLNVSTEYAEMIIEDDTASYNNIDLNSDVGAITIDLSLAKESAGWLIVSIIAR